MRIQHNILAMNAYRNYSNNTSAVSKNLEKLSSGYKINRAGDDAAGLAISEKMRAQITGLNAAQKNVKDGVSLVKTAEGAMQEIHDMLNRMDYLATQSANGTYDNEVDRANLQKEVTSLQAEINRIAESANFNGIKLLNGDMDATEAVTKEFDRSTADVTTSMESSLLPAKGSDLSVNTVLHQEANTGTDGTTFSVDLHNTVFANNAAGDDPTKNPASSMTLTVGDKSWTLEGIGGDALKGDALVNALVEKINENADANGSVELFNGQMFKVKAGTGGDGRITFTQVSAPSGADTEVDGDMKVEITGDVGSGTATAGIPAKKATYSIDLSNATNTTFLDQAGITAAATDRAAAIKNLAAGGNTNPTEAQITAELANVDDTDRGAVTADERAAQVDAVTSKIDGVNVVYEGNIDKTMQKFVEDYNSWKDAGTGATKNYVASWADGKLTLTAKYAGALDDTAVGDGTTVPTAAPEMTNVGTLTQNQEAVKAVYELDLSGLPAAEAQANMAAKTIDGVAIEWDTDMDTTMTKFVDKYNADTTKDYTAAWADGKLTMTAKNAGAIAGTGPAAAPATTITYTPATKATFTITVADPSTSTIAEDDTITVNGVDYTVKDAATGGGDITTEDAKDKAKLTAFIASKLASNDYDITVDADAGTITYTAKTAGAAATQPPFAFDTDLATTTTDLSVNGAFVAGTDVTHGAPATFANPTPGVDAGVTAGATAAFEETQAGAAAESEGNVVIGTADYNFKTTAIKNVTAESGQRLASTFFDLTEDMAKDGAVLTIGGQDYTFTSDEKIQNGDDDGNTKYVKIGSDLLSTVKNLTDAAKDNTTWTVGHDKGGSTLSFVEKQDQTEYLGEDGTSSLNTVDNIAATFGWTTPGEQKTETVEMTAGGKGSALTLQIGDTSDEFNQMKVSIGDMHAEAMRYVDEETGEVTSIADIDISTQEGAAKAIDVIKSAINYVSSIRGDLGATQNRLEHTANNLSIMAENIQDAESTIRDTDIAEEMMAYTKNNILVQSAQAMLAQANQVPQGVLQLLG